MKLALVALMVASLAFAACDANNDAGTTGDTAPVVTSPGTDTTGDVGTGAGTGTTGGTDMGTGTGTGTTGDTGAGTTGGTGTTAP